MTPPAALDAALAWRHGARDLPTVRVDAYNAELADPAGGGFLGDRASNRSFMEILEDWRMRVHHGSGGDDPLEQAVGQDRATHDIDRQELDEFLHQVDVDPEAAGLVHSAIEDFAQEMAGVVRRFLRLPEWRDTQRIAVGGGFLEARVGLMAVGRVGILLKAGGEAVQMVPISRHPDEAALCGAIHLAPPDLLHGKNAILAVDIGGTNMRAGLVHLGDRPDADPAALEVLAAERWRHRDEQPSRDEAVARLENIVRSLAGQARTQGLRLAPFVGVGCPGVIQADGTIERGAQNLPGGGWEGPGFNLPARLSEALSDLTDDGRMVVSLHNDAVVQGLSESHTMRNVDHWGVMTIGTGLGNARFSNVRQAGG